MKIITDIDVYKERIDKELLRKSKIPNIRCVFFDIDLKFKQGDAKNLETYLKSKYSQVEVNRCSKGIYEIIVTM